MYLIHVKSTFAHKAIAQAHRTSTSHKHITQAHDKYKTLKG